MAAAGGHLPPVSTLLELGASLTATNLAGNTPLHTAALNGHMYALEEMIQADADINRVNHQVRRKDSDGAIVACSGMD